ncbi:angiotensin-converting enzyme [Anopheles gambiae]|uniref:angiotensin-converting enzyme n=1 Tax=Anopheles gambiae TaxID=7165 RepID=UPI002AC8FC73|nr:angiotensin-converting enzyme [Anopheles gambiae]XP_061518112.1 angiotensin-converting enzyme [Anopheles gambiae]XP_061518113.1 angiotensin-converting enzyme [Anopheles gambiae]XP_061518114.1 angiotensin-converting enzyme [Anopheles gambiae]XP_061518115.1 angiotensin-converting enzyme [Anopheles gambiae]XP_061518116.1 angiotensin-converting enzyme [Anopheles gambiae]
MHTARHYKMLKLLIKCTIGALFALQSIHCEADPQLNLPPLAPPGLEGRRPVTFPNGEASPTRVPLGVDGVVSGDGSSVHDRSRSERFGPPYDGDDDEEDERPNYPAQQPEGRANDYDRRDRQDSPYSYNDRNRYGGDRGYDRNQNRERYPGDRSPNPYVSDVDNPLLYRDGGDRNRNRYVSDVDNPLLYRDRTPYNPSRDDDDRNRYNPNARPYNPNDPSFGGRNPPDPNYRGPGQRDPNYRDQGFQEPGQRFPGDDRTRYPDDPNYPYRSPEEERFRIENERRFRAETEKLRAFLTEIDRKSSLECSLNVAAQWNFETNINDATQVEALAAQQRYNDFQRLLWDQMRRIDQTKIFDDKLYRQVRLMSIIGPSALPPDQLDRYNRIVNDMLAIFNGATICAYEQPFECGLRLQPHLKDIMAKSRDWNELQYTWLEWRRKSGRNMRDLFEQLVDLTNDAGRVNNFTDAAAYWTFPYESRNFREEMEQVWREILPLYEMIHAYVRRKLREFYGPDKINKNAPLPDHILGDMYGQSWQNILDIVIPYPGRSFLEVTPEMQKQGYNPLVMFQIAEEFFVSMNMSAMPPDFWASSILTQPPDRPILCQPSSWDFCTGKDYRVKMCTQVTHKDFITVHHELAHIQYFLNYRNNPKVFRDGANPGFHEAIGDAISLSVASPKHLQNLGLVQKSVDDTAHDINFLFSLAMEKVVFLPFALALEAWRYDVFSKRVRKEQYNCHWWLLREEYGGVKPPVLRSELDFDPGAKYHVAANIPYIKYFFSNVLQFQIYRALCTASGQYVPQDPSKPLHKCDIYRQPAAGNILKKLMERGTSQPWQQVLQEVIGEGRLDGSALREFFRPLEEWLRNENLRNNEYVGWIYDGDYCKHSIETANLQVFGGFYNVAVEVQLTSWLMLMLSSWLVVMRTFAIVG